MFFRQKRSSETFLSYRIYGFNQTFDLLLIKDETFLSPSLFTQYFNENQTWINRDIKHCFYKGYVNDNRLSIISISLCGWFGKYSERKLCRFIVNLLKQGATKDRPILQGTYQRDF